MTIFSNNKLFRAPDYRLYAVGEYPSKVQKIESLILVGKY